MRKETAMFHDFDEEVFLGPETTVSLHFEPASGDDSEDWDIATGEALERAERNAWARHAQRGNGFGEAIEVDGDEDYSRNLREAIRHVHALNWD
jgi:hypothetical protein